MWSTCLTLVLAALTASTWAAPSPLTTSASTTATLSGLQSANPHDAILIHVIRTEDLIADELKSKPLLLEKLSHLLIRVQLGNQSVAVNGHHLPMLPGSNPLEVSVKLKQVQMVKMPKESPLVPLGLTTPEVLNIADKYMSEGIVAAMLSVTQEPMTVEAIREDHTPVQAEAYKVTIRIKILEVDGMSLAETDIPAIDLLHLVVHPDQSDSTKVSTVTTLAPQALLDPNPAASFLAGTNMGPAAMLNAAIDATRTSLEATLGALGHAMKGMASHASNMLNGSRVRKPCHKRPHPHHNHHEVETAVKTESNPVQPAAATKAPESKQTIGHQSAVSIFRHRMRCFIQMVARSSLAVLLLGIPIALVFFVFTALASFFLRRRLQATVAAAGAATVPPAYQAIPSDEKLAEDHQVIIIAVPDADKI